MAETVKLDLGTNLNTRRLEVAHEVMKAAVHAKAGQKHEHSFAAALGAVYGTDKSAAELAEMYMQDLANSLRPLVGSYKATPVGFNSR